MIIPNLPYPCKFLALREIAAVLRPSAESLLPLVSASAGQLVDDVVPMGQRFQGIGISRAPPMVV